MNVSRLIQFGGRAAAKVCAVIALIVATTIAGGVSDPAAAQTRFVNLNGGVQKIVIAPGFTTTIEVNEAFEDIVVGNPAVADVFPLTDASIYIQGRQSGFTNVAFYNEEKDLLGVIDIRVQLDYTELQDAIRQVVPDAQVSVSNVNNRIRLSGRVKDNVDLRDIVRLAEQYSEEPVIVAIRIDEARQVELDVRILEVERNSGRSLGAGINTSNGSFTTTPTTFAPFGTIVGNVLEISGVDVELVINTLEKKGLARRLANPKLITTSGIEANFVVGGEIPIQVATSDENGNVATSTGYREYGVRLNFIPSVLDEGLISLRIRPEVSDVDFSNTVNGQPSFITRKADTTVSLRDGQSFAIAGLLQANNDRNIEQLPWLGNIPILGTLFRSTSFQKRETDLVILVTPKLVKPATPDQPLVSPLDTTRSSNDVELFLLGMLEVDKDLLRYFREGEGVVGPYGHIIDLEFDDGLIVKK